MPHVRALRPIPPPPLVAERTLDSVPAVRLSPACPNCGRAPAVVFPALCVGKDAPLVCLACCPTETGPERPCGPGVAPH